MIGSENLALSSEDESTSAGQRKPPFNGTAEFDGMVAGKTLSAQAKKKPWQSGEDGAGLWGLKIIVTLRPDMRLQQHEAPSRATSQVSECFHVDFWVAP